MSTPTHTTATHGGAETQLSAKTRYTCNTETPRPATKFLGEEISFDSGYDSQLSPEPDSHRCEPCRATRSFADTLAPPRLSSDEHPQTVAAGVEPIEISKDDKAKRFEAIEQPFRRLVAGFLRPQSGYSKTGPKKHAPASVRWKYVPDKSFKSGYNIQIVSFCDAEDKKRLQKFLDTDEAVRSLCQPKDKPALYFQLTVEIRRSAENDEKPGMDLLFGALIESEGIFVGDSTLCGKSIVIQTSHRARKGTIGGLIKVEYTDGQTHIFGLTSGHIVRACIISEEVQGNMLETGEKVEYEGEGISHHSKLPSSTATAVTRCELEAHVFEHSQNIGIVVVHSDYDSGIERKAKGSYDWALLQMDQVLPNRLPLSHAPDSSANTLISEYWTCTPSLPKFKQLAAERVIIMCGSRNPKFGHMAASTASILVDAGEMFVTAYLVEPDDGNDFVEGDSGSWVVSEVTHKVIGHVVATDIYGSGYVIPLSDIMKDIKESNRDISSVSLPTLADIAAAKDRLLYHAFMQEQSELRQASCLPTFKPDSISYDSGYSSYHGSSSTSNNNFASASTTSTSRGNSKINGQLPSWSDYGSISEEKDDSYESKERVQSGGNLNNVGMSVSLAESTSGYGDLSYDDAYPIRKRKASRLSDAGGQDTGSGPDDADVSDIEQRPVRRRMNPPANWDN